MRIILDEREHALYEKIDSIVHFEGNSTTIQLSRKVLPLGDILIQTDEEKDVALIERKTLGDLLSSIKDGRYEEQSYRLIHSSGFPAHNIIYMIEGMYSQLRTLLEKKTVYSAITSLNYFKGFSVFRTCSLQETAETIVWMAEKIERNFQKGVLPSYLTQRPRPPNTTPITQEVTASSSEGGGEDENTVITASNYCSVVKKVKKENVTPENIGEIVLCQIPGVSSVTAMAIMKQYKTFSNLIDQVRLNPQSLENIVCESKGKQRKISKSCVHNIVAYLGTQTI
uniref:ERCC4 domain-containing protein n=1 Tax=viral metagenome TaxID=1070528 RepID=A0A6C0KHN2_9ZZZZ